MGLIVPSVGSHISPSHRNTFYGIILHLYDAEAVWYVLSIFVISPSLLLRSVASRSEAEICASSLLVPVFRRVFFVSEFSFEICQNSVISTLSSCVRFLQIIRGGGAPLPLFHSSAHFRSVAYISRRTPQVTLRLLHYCELGIHINRESPTPVKTLTKVNKWTRLHIWI